MNVNPTQSATVVPKPVESSTASAIHSRPSATSSINATAGVNSNVVPISAVEGSKDKLSSADIDSAVSSLNKLVDGHSTEVNFSVDKDAGEVVLKVVDTNNGELIRQIPNEESLRILSNARKNLDSTMSLMVDQHV